MVAQRADTKVSSTVVSMVVLTDVSKVECSVSKTAEWKAACLVCVTAVSKDGWKAGTSADLKDGL